MFFLKRNLPKWERATRVIAGAAIVAVVASGLVPAGVLMWVALASAATLVLTAFVG
ncbi:MAG: DUF2892 domain-containing protein, partial [Undibacterium sp.]|nr:DUF2892 domain-containing protein [Undibacterium sp.]